MKYPKELLGIVLQIRVQGVKLPFACSSCVQWMNPNFSDEKLHLYDHESQHNFMLPKRNFLLHFGGLQMTLESAKHVNNPAEMVKN